MSGIIFTRRNVERILAGQKTESRRKVSDKPTSRWYSARCGLEPGKTYAVQPGRGQHAVARIRIVDIVRREPLSAIDEAGARREGYRNRAAFFRAWRAIHGDVDLNEPVWAFRFELVQGTALERVFTDGERAAA